MPHSGRRFPSLPTVWRISVWLNDGATKNAALLATAIVDDLDQARVYAEQTAASTLRTDPAAYVWVEAWPGHQPSRRGDWTPSEGQGRVAVFTETHRLGTWVTRSVSSQATEQL